MENEPPPIENPPPGWGEKIGFLFLAFTPLPLGLLFNPLRLFVIAQGNKSADPTPLIVFNIFTIIFCVMGTIGMCGGYGKGRWIARIGGIVAGLFLWIVEVSIVLFMGCCQGLSHIH